MTKRLIMSGLILLLTLALPAAALCEGGSIPSVAVFEGGRIYYSGSLDGYECGVYAMDAGGGGAVKLYDEDMPILGAAEGRALIAQWETDGAILVEAGGRVVATIPEARTSVLFENGRFYTAISSFAADGTRYERFLDVPEDAYPFLTPLALSGTRLYLADDREYGYDVAEYNNGRSLAVYDSSDGSVRQISGAGTKLLGIDGEYLYYERKSFDVYPSDLESENLIVEVDEGLFRADLSGENETRMGGGEWEEDVYDDFKLVSGGVAYGIRYDYSAERFAEALIRVDASGAELEPIPLGEGYNSLQAVVGNEALFVRTLYSGDDEDFWQRDEIVFLDIDCRAERVLSVGQGLLLQYSEGDPEVLAIDGRIYFAAYDIDEAATGLYAADGNGSSVTRLAVGYKYEGGGEDW